jgi:hypothetical protein
VTDLICVAVTIVLIAALARLVALVDERLPNPSPDPHDPVADPATATSQPGGAGR